MVKACKDSKVSGRFPDGFRTPETESGSLAHGGIIINLSPVQKKIFMLMSKEDKKYSGAELIRLLNIKKSTVYDGIKRLCTLNLLSVEGKTYPHSYILTRAGKRQVSGFVVGYDEKSGIYDRSHAWRFKVEVKSFPKELPPSWEPWSMNNWIVSRKVFFVDGLEVEVRKNGDSSLSISFSEVRNPDIQATEDRAYYVAYKTLEVIRAELKGIDLGQIELLNVCLTGVHHTLTGDPYAVACANSKVTMKGECHSVDSSTGIPETECDSSNPVKNKAHLLKYAGFVDAVMLNELNPWETQKSVERLNTVIDKQADFIENKVMPTIADFSVNIQAHTGTAKANLEASMTLNRALDRMDRLLIKPLEKQESSTPSSNMDKIRKARKNYYSRIN